MNYKLHDSTKKNESLVKELKLALQELEGFGVEEIEDALNNLREKTLSEWQKEEKGDPIKELNLPHLTYRVGIEELSKPFKLEEPQEVQIILSSGTSTVNDGKAAMQINNKSKVISIYVDRFSCKDGKYLWKETSVKDIFFMNYCMPMVTTKMMELFDTIWLV